MKDNRNITIAVLAVSALVLLAVLLGSQLQTPSAYAEASVKQSDYIIVNGSVDSAMDIVYVINISARKVVAYAPNRQNHTLNIVDSVGLEK